MGWNLSEKSRIVAQFLESVFRNARLARWIVFCDDRPPLTMMSSSTFGRSSPSSANDVAIMVRKVSGFELLHRRLALLLADLRMDKERTWNRRLVFLAQRDARYEDERLHVQMLKRVIDGVRIPVSVLADADVHQGFPGAHPF